MKERDLRALQEQLEAISDSSDSRIEEIQSQLEDQHDFMLEWSTWSKAKQRAYVEQTKAAKQRKEEAQQAARQEENSRLYWLPILAGEMGWITEVPSLVISPLALWFSMIVLRQDSTNGFLALLIGAASYVMTRELFRIFWRKFARWAYPEPYSKYWHLVQSEVLRRAFSFVNLVRFAMSLFLLFSLLIILTPLARSLWA